MIKASDLSPETRARMGLPADAPTNKYKVSSKDTRTADGITFHSKAEMHYYRDLLAMKSQGLVKMFLRQVRIDLPGNTKYVLDFLVFYTDGRIEWIDVKGMRTPAYIKAKKQVEALYPLAITEVLAKKRRQGS